jgi:predicted alpha/beta superfamily hydrolase
MQLQPRPVFSIWLTTAILFVAAGDCRAQTNLATKAPAELVLKSSVMGEDRRIIVRLPRGYESDMAACYPVLYKFDGDNQLARYDSSVDVLSSMDLTPDVIIVALPNGRGARNRDLTPSSLHQDGNEKGEMGTGEMGRGDRFLDFIEKELIPYVEANYRTTRERILAGHSRGALLVLQSLISKPDLFQARLMFSAPVMRDEQRLITETRKFFRGKPRTKSFLYCNWGGNENEGMNRSYHAMKALLTTDAPSGLRWVVERARAADHQQTQIIALPSALYEYFRGAQKVTPALKNRTAQVRSTSGVRKP